MTTQPDLSKFHQVVSNMFAQPQTQHEWDQYRVTEKQVVNYNESSHLSGIKLLEEWQVDQLNTELAEITNPEHPGNNLFYKFHSNESADSNSVLFHSLGHWRIQPGFHDILWNPRFLKIASQLLGDRSVRFWHDQLFCKPAQHGGVVAWHQDYSYWTRTVAMQHLSCWVALDDASEENGCLQYIPKSHQWGLLQKPELAGDMDGLLEYLTPEQKASFKPVPIELSKGHATFHHPLMVHGSYENKSSRSRRALVLNVFADGTISATNDALLEGVPVIPKGHKMDGQFFPLLYQAEN